MKKYAILTSILALAACGGGSGGGYVVDTPIVPDNISNSGYVPTGTTKDDAISLPTQIVTNKEEVIEYVESRIGAPEAKGGAQTSRAAKITLNNIDGWTIDERYTRAVNALVQMEQVLGKLVDLVAGSDDQLNSYVAQNEDAVKNALKLIGDKSDVSGVDNAQSAEALVEIFQKHEIHSHEDLRDKKDHVVPQAKIHKIDDINFTVADFEGQTRQMKLKTENGKIVGISDAEWGPEGFAVTGRVGTTNEFQKTIYSYVWTFENSTVDVYSANKNLSRDEFRQMAIDRIEEKRAHEKQKCEELPDSCYQDYEEHYDKLVKQLMDDDFTYKNDGELSLTQNIESMGKSAGLKYSDFGLLHKNLDVFAYESNEKWIQKQADPYAGGYDDMKISKDDMSGKMVFSGDAVVSVSRLDYEITPDGNSWSENGDNLMLVTKSSDAKLTFNDGNSRLEMKFPDYYTIAIDDKDNTIAFSDGDKVDENIRFSDYAHNNTVLMEHKWHSINKLTQGMFNTDYYGDNGTPSEAVSTFGYSEIIEPYGEENGSLKCDNCHDINMLGAFGGVKK